VVVWLSWVVDVVLVVTMVVIEVVVVTVVVVVVVVGIVVVVADDVCGEGRGDGCWLMVMVVVAWVLFIPD